MSIGQDYENRMIKNVEGVFIAVIAGALATIGESLAEVAESTDSSAADGSIWALFFVVQNYPTVIVLTAVVVVTASAGPFGLLGFVFEAAGASLFLSDPLVGLFLFAIGAAIIVVGARLWSWTSFIKWFFSKRRSGRGKYGRGR